MNAHRPMLLVMALIAAATLIAAQDKPAPPPEARPVPPSQDKPAPSSDSKPAPSSDRNPAPPSDSKPAPPSDSKPAPAPDAQPLPVSEDQIVREMEAVIDRTGPGKEKDLGEARELVTKGVRSYDAHDYEKSLAAFRKALELDPLNSTAYYEMALTYSTMGDQIRALDSIIRSLTIDPKAEMSYVLKGNILDNLGFPERAKQTYRALLDVKPDSYMGLIEMGTCELRLEDLDAAEASYKKASEVDPSRPSAWYRLGFLAARRGQDYDERKYLEKFLVVGKNDPRADAVRKALADLDKTEIRVDPDAPYSSIDLMVSMARVVWKQKHRESHPEAHGYALTLEEEKAIDEETILPQWRAEKAKNPAAAHPYYDLVLKVTDAGYLTEYIYYTKRSAIGAPALTWLKEHPDKVQAFEGWARKEGLMREENPGKATEDSAADAPDPVVETLRTMTESKVHYVIDTDATAEDAARYRREERARFGKSVKLSGPNKADCPRSVAAFRDRVAGRDKDWDYVAALRCTLPGDPIYQEAARSISTIGLRVRELEGLVRGGVFVDGDTVHVKYEKGEWLAYLDAKAVWRMEPELRAKWRGESSYKPSVEEEAYAWLCASLAYERMRASKDEAADKDAKSESGEKEKKTRVDPKEGAAPEEPEEKYVFEADPVLDRVVEVSKTGTLRGFVLYEVLHKSYGISLESLSKADADAVGAYIRGWVFQSVSRK